MKKLVSLVLLFATFHCFSQNIPGHPRILLLENEETGIWEGIKKDTNWALIHQNIIEEADHINSLPPLERIQIGRRLLDKSREALRRIFILSYAYRMTKNKQYFDRCEAELLKIATFSDWNPTHFFGCSRNDPCRIYRL